MNKGSSLLRLVGLLALLVVVAAVGYVRIASMRAFADDKLPFVKNVLGRFVSEDAAAGNPTGADEAPAAPGSVPVPDEATLLKQLPNDQASWPKTVILKKATEFPAVANGKEVGKVQVPAGSEANVRLMKDGSVGLEYRGGGAWVKFEETDLVERWRAARSKPAPAAPAP